MPITHFPNGITNYGVPVDGACIPPIIGTYYHVCLGDSRITNGQGQQITGKASNSGLTPQEPLDSIVTAYNKCVDGAGDGIIIWGYGAYASAYPGRMELSGMLEWRKGYITVVGITPPVKENHQIKISIPASVDSKYVLSVIGSNNTFINMKFQNLSSNGYGAVIVSGGNNYFANVHFSTWANSNQISTGNLCAMYVSGGDYNRFYDCSFGNYDTNFGGNQASITGIIKFGNASCIQNYFEKCRITACYSTAQPATSGSLYFASGSGLVGVMEFRDCTFISYNSVGKENINQTQSVIVGNPTGAPYGAILISGSSAAIGFSSWDNSESDVTYISVPQSGSVGGLATTP